MPENNEKIYVGNGRSFGEFGQIGISLCLSNLPKEHFTTDKNGKKYIKLNVSPRKEPDNYGNTHSVSVNTWKKE